jgi:hypothetical protein
MVGSGIVLFLMSVLCYHWQKATDMPLLEFALSVMTFAYAGLIGVYFTAVFTRRGNVASVLCALVLGFLTILFLQPYCLTFLGLKDVLPKIAFPFQLCIGALVATLTCWFGAPMKQVTDRGAH